MSVVFSVHSMLADLRGFSKSAAKFLVTKDRLEQLETQLDVAVSNAKGADRSVRWSTDYDGEPVPIRTRLSKNYRGYNTGTKKIFAEICFDFEGELDATNEDCLLINAGATHIKMMWEDQSRSTEYHFDIHPKKAGHPMLHLQFVGGVSEIPRIISLFAHPLDILELTLMEIFQDEWRQARGGLSCLQNLHLFPSNQRKRIISVMQEYAGLLQDESETVPLYSLQNRPSSPLDLYPG